MKCDCVVSEDTLMEDVLSILSQSEVVGVVNKEGTLEKYIDKETALKIFIESVN